MGRGKLAGLRILIVEDYFALAESLSIWLEQEGCKIVGPVPSVEAALAIIEQGQPLDGALLDVNLRGRSVAPVARRLREMKTPIVFLTGHTEIDELLGEFADYRWISKPAEEHTVLGALAEMRAA